MIAISDVHLGMRASQADALCTFLKANTCDDLYLVGDIIDGWRLQRRWYFPQSHVNVLRRIFTAAKRGTRVHYVLGNHDEFLRPYLRYNIHLGGIKLVNQCEHTLATGKKFLVIHGDFFDPIMHNTRWLMILGDAAYNALIWFNLQLNWIRKKLGLPQWSLSNYLKQTAKQAVNFISNYEQQLANYCKQNGYDGIICGHIHSAAIKEFQDITYVNTGDFVESATAVVEHSDGTLELIHVNQV